MRQKNAIDRAGQGRRPTELHQHDESLMRICPAWMTRLLAASAALVAICATTAIGSVHVTYNVGGIDNPGSDDAFFSASWLHDASMSLNPHSGTLENGAYRTGNTSGFVSGGLYGELDPVNNELRGIGGTLTGNLKMLLHDSDSGLDGHNFELRLGQDAGSGKTGALKFETDGAGTGQYSGGFMDFELLADGLLDSLKGTFFFKPQAETGSTMLSPNRGNSTTFTLWGYDWMHDSGPFDGSTLAVDWLKFLGDLGYDGGEVLRQGSIADGGQMLLAQTLGIALYVTDPDPPPTNFAANPEPTTFIVWGVLSMIGASFCRRQR